MFGKVGMHATTLVIWISEKKKSQNRIQKLKNENKYKIVMKIKIKRIYFTRRIYKPQPLESYLMAIHQGSVKKK